MLFSDRYICTYKFRYEPGVHDIYVLRPAYLRVIQYYITYIFNIIRFPHPRPTVSAPYITTLLFRVYYYFIRH